MSAMDDLIAFWRARLDEAEAIARAATPGNWQAGPEEATGMGFFQVDIDVLEDPGSAVAVLTGSPYDGDTTRGDAAHIALNDPASVLADIAADRELLAMLEDQDGFDLPEGVHDGRDYDEREMDERAAGTLEEVARIRAARFSGHPDWKAEWAP